LTAQGFWIILEPEIVTVVSLTCYGGVNEIGGNKVLLEDGEVRLFFDFGLPFAHRSRYYEEYLNPRASWGLLDLLEVGLLPPLNGIYRQDLTLPDLWDRFSSSPHYRELHIDGVLLSHAHLDHSGYISFLDRDIPVYTTAMTSVMAKAIQDSAKGDFEKEVCYAIPKEDKKGARAAIRYNKAAAQQRPFRVLDCGAWSGELGHFWEDTPGRRSLEACPLETAVSIGPLPLRCFPVDHSIPGATALAVATGRGWVVYTGDLRLHGGRGQQTEAFIHQAAQLRPVILICEGTSVDDETCPVTEDGVYSNALKAIREAKGLVIADFGPRNVERLLTFRRIAQEIGRYLVVTAKDAYLLRAMHYLDPEVPDMGGDPVIRVYQELKADHDHWEQDILARFRDKLVKAEEVGRCQDDHILCFSFFDINELPSIRPQEGSLYLYSSSEPHNEEQRLDFYRLHQWLEHFRMRGIGLPREELGWKVPQAEQGLHASGHATGPELLKLIKEINPEILIPIHTENPGYFATNLEGTGIRVHLPRYGEQITLP